MEKRNDEFPNNAFINGPPLSQGRLYQFDKSAMRLKVIATTEPLDPNVAYPVGSEFPNSIVPATDRNNHEFRDVVEVPEGLQFVVPDDLLEMTIRVFGEEQLGRTVINRARQLSKVADGMGAIGFWRRLPICYPYLLPVDSVTYPDDFGKLYGYDQSELNQLKDKFGSSLEFFGRYMRGYIGWLMSDRLFQEELRQLQDRFPDAIKSQGFPMIRECRLHAGHERSEFHTQCAAFYEAWILEGMAAPGLPIPIAPQFPSFGQSDGGGRVQYTIPDYLPTPGQGQLLEILDGSRSKARSRPKLAGWFEIIEKDNASLNKIDPYCRSLPLQWYWRGLTATFPSTSTRAKEKLTSLFAGFFNVSEDTVKRDVKRLDANLGSGWRMTNEACD